MSDESNFGSFLMGFTVGAGWRNRIPFDGSPDR